MLKKLIVYITRYDKEGVGAIRQTELFKLLGLDKDGYLVNTATPRNVMLNTRAKTFVDLVSVDI